MRHGLTLELLSATRAVPTLTVVFQQWVGEGSVTWIKFALWASVIVCQFQIFPNVKKGSGYKQC
jgi:hypothetical protein